MVTIPFVQGAQETFLETLKSDMDGNISISQSTDAIIAHLFRQLALAVAH
jgi:hypothetical protein